MNVGEIKMGHMEMEKVGHTNLLQGGDKTAHLI